MTITAPGFTPIKTLLAALSQFASPASRAQADHPMTCNARSLTTGKTKGLVNPTGARNQRMCVGAVAAIT